MQEFQQRVVTEETELKDKIDKLTAFLPTGIFRRLPEEEQGRLREQLDYMTKYDGVLVRRIAAFQD